MVFKNFPVMNFFTLLPVKHKLSKLNLSNDYKYPAYSSDSSNNGIIGYAKEPEFVCDNVNRVYITFGDHTRTMNIARKSFSVLDNVKVLKPCIDNDEILLYLITVWKKGIRELGYARHWKVARECQLILPIKVENNIPLIDPNCTYHKDGYIPDFEYMHNYISKLEHEHILKLDEYLTSKALNDYQLTDKNVTILSKSKKMIMKDFRIDSIFYVFPPKKRFNAINVTITEDKGHPYVVRSSTNNGIRGYIEEDEQYLNDANTFSFGQDTATIFWQPKPYFTGDKIKVLKPKFTCNEELAMYMINRVNVTFSTFSWGSQSFKMDVIKSRNLSLPIQTDKNNNPIIDPELKYHKDGYIPDWDFMEQYIKAIEKLVITDVVKYKDSLIEQTNKMIDN